jgi:tetratricopeptide (TPR) repeat protein
MFDEAIEENRKWGEHTRNTIKTDVSAAHIYAAAGRHEEARQIIVEVERKNLSDNDYRGMGIAYAALGDTDKAFEWLDKSYEMHEESLCSLLIEPKLDSLRKDKRFKELLEKVGLVDLSTAAIPQ